MIGRAERIRQIDRISLEPAITSAALNDTGHHTARQFDGVFIASGSGSRTGRPVVPLKGTAAYYRSGHSTINPDATAFHSGVKDMSRGASFITQVIDAQPNPNAALLNLHVCNQLAAGTDAMEAALNARR